LSETVQQQVSREQQEIQNAPQVSLGPPVGRCGKCGRPSRVLVHYETVDAVERFKGECCAGDADRVAPQVRSGGLGRGR